MTKFDFASFYCNKVDIFVIFEVKKSRNAVNYSAFGDFCVIFEVKKCCFHIYIYIAKG